MFIKVSPLQRGQILREALSTKVKTNTYTFKMHTKTKCHKQNSKGKHAQI